MILKQIGSLQMMKKLELEGLQVLLLDNFWCVKYFATHEDFFFFRNYLFQIKQVLERSGSYLLQLK